MPSAAGGHTVRGSRRFHVERCGLEHCTMADEEICVAIDGAAILLGDYIHWPRGAGAKRSYHLYWDLVCVVGRMPYAGSVSLLFCGSSAFL